MVFNEQPDEMSLQLFTRIKNITYHIKSSIIISWWYILSRGTGTHFIAKPKLSRISKSNWHI